MAESFYLFSDGVLQRKDNVLRITAADGRFKDIKIEMTRDIYIFSEVELNTSCLNYSGQLSIPIHFFNYYGFYTGSFYPKEKNVSGKLLVEQVQHYTHREKRMVIARELTNAAGTNILRNLRYYNTRGRDLDSCISEIKALMKGIDTG